jgi:hypothetical protein
MTLSAFAASRSGAGGFGARWNSILLDDYGFDSTDSPAGFRRVFDGGYHVRAR